MQYRSSFDLACVVLSISPASASLAQQPNIDSSIAGLQAPSVTDASAASLAQSADERFAAHGQAAFLEQLASPFHAPYSGLNSLSPRHGQRRST
jgi:hypothetical protein